MSRASVSPTSLPSLGLTSPESESRHEDTNIHDTTIGTTSSRSSRGATPSSASRAKRTPSSNKLPSAQSSSPNYKPTKPLDKSHVTPLPPSSAASKSNNNAKPFQCKLNALQISALLKPFWSELLQNHLKPVRKVLQDTHLKSIDFDSTLVRYAPNADATPVHICAQFGFLAMAKMLVNEFRLGTNHRNKVGSTPLHVACRCGHAAMVSWLVDELHVPVDVPDTQQRIAFDVAPYDVVDKCVLAPLRTQYAQLRRTEEELVEQSQHAQEELAKAQLQFRRRAMVLNDSETHVDEERAKIEVVSAVERQWYEQLQSKSQVLAGFENEYDHLRQILQDEQANAQVLFEREVRDVQERNTAAKQELQALQALVKTTQRELDRRKQLLVDQLGVFDVALVEFPGSKEVQQWALASLLAIASSENNERLDKHTLLLRAEPVDVVRHVLTAFPSDYRLQVEAVELLIAIQRIHSTSGTATVDTAPLFVKAIVESDLLLVLGECLGRWLEVDQAKATPLEYGICHYVFEAVYLCLRLPRNAQRAVALCQRKYLQLLPLRALEICRLPSQRRHIALLLLTYVQYGVKKTLLSNGVVRIVFAWLTTVTEDVCVDEDDRTATIETAQNLFATLALLTTLPSQPKHEKAKFVEPRQLEELTTDSYAISALAVVRFLRCYVTKPDEIVGVSMWAFKLLLNLAEHGGPIAGRVRQELLGEDGFGCCAAIIDALKLVLVAEANTQAVQAGLDLVQAVWIERFDNEGQLLLTHQAVLASLVDVAVVYSTSLLINSHNLPDLAGGLRALSRAVGNSDNAAGIVKRAVGVEASILQPILLFIIQYVDETRSSYREPVLVQLLFHILKLFLHISQARLRATQPPILDTFTRDLHKNSREIGVCTVLKAFKHDQPSGLPELPPDPTEWLALKALCMLIVDLIHCSC